MNGNHFEKDKINCSMFVAKTLAYPRNMFLRESLPLLPSTPRVHPISHANFSCTATRFRMTSLSHSPLQ
ncbi:hypothetical protein VDGL01_05261 [Verticillium dahliae]